MKTDNMNFNITDQYIQARRDFGSTTFYNVGTGTFTPVPWGHLDWFNFSVSAAFTVAVNVGLIWVAGHWFKVW